MPFPSPARGGPHLRIKTVGERVSAVTDCGTPAGAVRIKKQEDAITNGQK